MSRRGERGINWGAITLICFTIFSLLLTSCIGDGAARVKGRVVSATGEGINNCVLELYSLKDNKLIRVIDNNYGFYLDGQFDLSFTIAPSFKKYYFVIRCEGYAPFYKTKVYEMGGDKYMRNPIDLGIIALEK
jgi:hypothetical protein